jgi:hypothetical protein
VVTMMSHPLRSRRPDHVTSRALPKSFGPDSVGFVALSLKEPVGPALGLAQVVRNTPYE